MCIRDSSIIMQNLVEIEQLMEAWEYRVWCFHFFLYIYNAPQITIASDLVALLQQEIALIFVGRFKCGLQHFFREEKPFAVKGTHLKMVARWRCDTCRNARKKITKSEKMGAKFVRSAHHFDHLKARWKKTSTKAFYPMYCRCAPV